MTRYKINGNKDESISCFRRNRSMHYIHKTYRFRIPEPKKTLKLDLYNFIG